ncbi:glycoside hydrolase family 16 protein [Curtobacterium oceanosedimentum]|uniref:glycoside hydrolase family 16 protein n=1 Tax=Curtobacterium oceanosedimentum TaxID=465820 RepID=UPI001CE1183D|nr:glycoside hydrolase family 16 protein [Curtobacterium oceanosedimentum]MCA5922077.1 family 16 glycosylhydrolase [Curtobacterium oceanosedimentum]
MNRRRRAVLVAAAASALVIGVPTAAAAHPWCDWRDGGHRPPSAAPVPAPTDSPEPADESTVTAEPAPPADEPTPVDDAASAPVEDTVQPDEATAPAEAGPADDDPEADPAPEPASLADLAAIAPDVSFVEDFDVPAATGLVTAAYPQSWQPYPDGTSGIYAPSRTVSVHDGVLDVALGTGAGAAGTFGSADGAWDHVGGSFSVRAKATGGDGNGAAFMLWPTSNVWSDGEIDFPEGNFESNPSVFHHSMTPGREAERVQVDTGVSWRDWHTYTVDWVPGESVTYSVDGTELRTITEDVPTTPHRFMFQVGNWGDEGNLLIDWVSTTE